MRFSNTLALLSMGAMASASALPNMLGAYDLAMPIAERDVPTIECDNEPMYTGSLKLVSAKGRESNAAFEGIRNADGLQQLDVGKAGAAAREERFSFTSCRSSFMGYDTEYTKAAEVYFGRLQPASLVGKRCVSASQLAVDSARLVADKCSSSDDSGQMLQFWVLTKQPTGNGEEFTYYLSFPGQPKDDGSGDFSGSYTISKVTQDNNKLVKLAYEEEEGAPSPYFLKLA
ncbi:uncharacterized protein PFL1_03152 [Pseudozyma flocculosa PF-1]|uniref:Uncharacterized protein n=2 Tax=Pseudozyma flocculosa TaxID=84751 RepID=A0A5C3F1I8_9BASI|nr:uncharacterized protein PFL1_03152 [Pseudozyma flocculosa PF-1]EPQ29397.1 hypothetical protein PFL1_03152 [Pseudozyma flocculosa PF-1]SPO37920.1 uncharacterized protein PSFLO_03397 [Pseudozyma flocculosa]